MKNGRLRIQFNVRISKKIKRIAVLAIRIFGSFMRIIK